MSFIKTIIEDVASGIFAILMGVGVRTVCELIGLPYDIAGIVGIATALQTASGMGRFWGAERC